MAMRVTYLVLDGEIISENRNGDERDYLPDPQGNTVALLDNTQTKTDTFSYWPYGELVNRTGTTPTPFQYGGKWGYYKDSSSKLYVRRRVEDVVKGRWFTQDPIGFQGGLNLFRYVGSSPMTWVDPTGTDIGSAVGHDDIINDQRANCGPIVYNCSRNFGSGFWPFHHPFFWIHYPCDPGLDSSVSYGPIGSYPIDPKDPKHKRRNVTPGEPDDIPYVHYGEALCHRTNCMLQCIRKCGDEVKIGGPWDPGDYVYPYDIISRFISPIGDLLNKDCWLFNDLCKTRCGCDQIPDFPYFTPTPIEVDPIYKGDYRDGNFFQIEKAYFHNENQV